MRRGAQFVPTKHNKYVVNQKLEYFDNISFRHLFWQNQNIAHNWKNITKHYTLHEEEFEDTKGAIRIRISKKNRQHNGQKKKDKRTNNDLEYIHKN